VHKHPRSQLSHTTLPALATPRVVPEHTSNFARTAPAPTSQSFQSTPPASLAPAPAPAIPVVSGTHLRLGLHPRLHLHPSRFKHLHPHPSVSEHTPDFTHAHSSSAIIIQEHGVHVQAALATYTPAQCRTELVMSKAHLANWNNHEVNVVPSTQALEVLQARILSKRPLATVTAICLGHNMSISFFMHHSTN